MNAVRISKINQLLQRLPSGALYFSSWMYKNNISYELQRNYRNSGWLTSLSEGVMYRTGQKPTLFGALSCLNYQMKKPFYIGALSALELKGYAHYVPMGRQRIVVYCPRETWFPVWFQKYDWGFDILKLTSENFHPQTGITNIVYGDFKILMSDPERAFMECLDLAPKYYNLMDLYHVMEHLTALRPNIIQTLLEQSNSIKVNRLFLYMAEKADHAWFEMIDTSKIQMGSGKRALVKNGVYDSKYQITIPKELKDYE